MPINFTFAYAGEKYLSVGYDDSWSCRSVFPSGDICIPSASRKEKSNGVSKKEAAQQKEIAAMHGQGDQSPVYSDCARTAGAKIMYDALFYTFGVAQVNNGQFAQFQASVWP